MPIRTIRLLAPKAWRRQVICLALPAILLLALLSQAHADAESPHPPPLAPKRQVMIVGKLADEELIAASTNLAGLGRTNLFLIHTPRSELQFRSLYKLGKLPAPDFVDDAASDGLPDLQGESGIRTVTLRHRRNWHDTGTHKAVICPAQPRSLLLQAACLAGVLQRNLYPVKGGEQEAARLRRWLQETKTCDVLTVGNTAQLLQDLPGVHVETLKDAAAVAELHLTQLCKQGPIRTLVVTNPADVPRQLGTESTLAPWIALQHRAVLLCTNEVGDNTAAMVKTALQDPDLSQVDAVILAANLKAIPMTRRPNPVPGKDAQIEMEPLTPSGTQPITFATGRLFHEDLGVLSVLLARQQLLSEQWGKPVPRRALIVSNPGGGLNLVETFSRHTANEFRNRGYQTTALFNEDVTKEKVRELMPSQDVFLWEGHYRTMVDKFEMPKWTETLQPSLVFLQSCLALNEVETRPLFERGAIGVVGSSTRTYSGSGGAFTLAFFDAQLYEQQTLGGSLRHAKNFLVAYALLKEKLLRDKAKLGGANIRSSWAFTLWGDPTLRLPMPELPPDSRAPVRHEVHGHALVLELPGETYERIIVKPYEAEMRPNARMAGLLTREGEDERRLVPFLFAEVSLPKAPAGKTPRLTCQVPSRHWVFNWDSRRKCGYLLVAPRKKDDQEIRFHVSWEG
jgi:hypothetical protein